MHRIQGAPPGPVPVPPWRVRWGSLRRRPQAPPRVRPAAPAEPWAWARSAMPRSTRSSEWWRTWRRRD